MNELKAGVKHLIARGFDAEVSDEEFELLALAIHAHQSEQCEPIRRIAPPRIDSWRDIPLVPVSLFARYRFATFPPEQSVRVFRSSGTTASERSAHWFDDLDLYRGASMAGARWALGDGVFHVSSLIPESSESSLACMASFMAEEFRKPLSLAADAADDDSADSSDSANVAPRIVIGAAFTFVELMDAGARTPLPAGSVVIETGGYKGRNRSISRQELYEGICRVYELPMESIISEYGMCELSSPLWQRWQQRQRIGMSSPPDERLFHAAPWTRIRIIDPETMRDAEEGLIGIYDLANIHSCIGILTADLGRVEPGGLRFLGRLEEAPAKGCSFMIGNQPSAA